MAVNTQLPLQVQTLDTSNPLSALARTRMGQEQEAYTRQRTAQQDARQAKMDEAALSSKELNDKLTREQIVKAQYDNLDEREQSRIKSVAIAAAQFKPLADAGKWDELTALASARQRKLHSRMAGGEHIDSEDTDAFLEMLNKKDYESAKWALDSALETGYMTGALKRAEASGGTTNQLIDRLKSETPGMTTQQALGVIKGGGTINPETGEVTNPAKPLPPNSLKQQNEALDAIGLANNINADMGAIANSIDAGDVKLGAVVNAGSSIRNFTGNSDTISRNYSTLKASLEKLRNDSLRLNKGVQTDGDAQRAWNELMENLNDEKLVAKRLRDIQAINERAAELKKNEVSAIRENYGQPEVDYSKYDKGSAIKMEGKGGIKFLGFEE